MAETKMVIRVSPDTTDVVRTLRIIEDGERA